MSYLVKNSNVKVKAEIPKKAPTDDKGEKGEIKKKTAKIPKERKEKEQKEIASAGINLTDGNINDLIDALSQALSAYRRYRHQPKAGRQCERWEALMKQLQEKVKHEL